MTVEELNKLFYINQEIASLKKELEELRETNFYGKKIITDMPLCKGGVQDANLDYVERVVELEESIYKAIKKRILERERIYSFIEAITDETIRLIVRLRAINNMSWEEIGKRLNMDRRTVSRKFYQYFTEKPN